MIIIFEDKEKNFERSLLYDILPHDTLFINSYLISSSIVSDLVFDTLQDNKKIKDCDNRNYKKK